MDNASKESRSVILKRGIFDFVRGVNVEKNKDAESKELTPLEVASVFEEDEIRILMENYECLKYPPSYYVEKICEEVIGQEEVAKKLVYVCYFNQIANLAEEVGLRTGTKRINLLMIGPTGCGKTSLINALKKHFKVPIVKYSSDSITSAGYIGNKVEDILLRLFEESGRNLALAERGIIYIDEIDKKRTQQTSVEKDINGTAVQQELLKILEPNVIDLRLVNKARVPFDTSKLTVLMGGAFVGLDEIKKKRICKKSLGFKNKEESYSDEELMKIEYTPEDIIAYGFIPEFVGRSKIIVGLRKLDADDMIKIMFRGKNSPYLENVWILANELNVEQQISVEYLKSLARELANSKTGARDLEGRITKMFYPIIQIAFEHQGEYGILDVDDEGSFRLTYDSMEYYGEVGK